MKSPQFCSKKECVEIIAVIEEVARNVSEPYRTRFDEIFDFEMEEDDDESQSPE